MGRRITVGEDLGVESGREIRVIRGGIRGGGTRQEGSVSGWALGDGVLRLMVGGWEGEIVAEKGP